MKTKIISFLSASFFIALFVIQVFSTPIATENQIISVSGSDGVNGICCDLWDRACTNAGETWADAIWYDGQFCI